MQSVIRAALGNLMADDIESGSSTLTMQLVKNIFVQKALEEPTEAERDAAFEAATAPDFDRKLKEMKLAIGLEKRYTKNEILNAYLNIAFFGDNTYGIQAAAQRYYSVNAKDLTLAQAASLIAIVQYPNQRGLDDPENYAANQERRDDILDAMLERERHHAGAVRRGDRHPGRRDHDPAASHRRTAASARTRTPSGGATSSSRTSRTSRSSARPRRSARRTGSSAATSCTPPSTSTCRSWRRT